jgi:hypothetical protein
MPIQEASKLLNIGVTVLKRKCRQYNIPRWPYRKLKSIQNLYQSMSNLECQQMDHGGIDVNNIRETKLKLFVERESMVWDPAISLNNETKKLRQSNFKYEYKVRREYPCSRSGDSGDAADQGHVSVGNYSPATLVSADKDLAGAMQSAICTESDASTAISRARSPEAASIAIVQQTACQPSQS